MRDAFTKQLEDNISDAINKLKEKLSPETQALIRKKLTSVYIKRYKQMIKKPSETMTIYNNWLFKSMYIVIGGSIILITIVTLLLIYQCNQCVPIKEIIVENILTFLFVGVIEYLFFTMIALKYIPVMPSLMADSFFADINKKLDELVADTENDNKIKASDESIQ